MHRPASRTARRVRRWGGRDHLVLPVPVERGEPYVTQAYAFMVLDGAQNGGGHSAMRHAGLRQNCCPSRVRRTATGTGRSGIPAPTVENISATRAPRSWRRDPTATSTRSAPAAGPARSAPPRAPFLASARRRRPELRPNRQVGRLIGGWAGELRLYEIRLPHRARTATASAGGRAVTWDLDGDGGVGDRPDDVRPRPRRVPASQVRARTACRGQPGAGACCATVWFMPSTP